jgi:sulfoxide reductase heme-binding subunit YedZ
MMLSAKAFQRLRIGVFVLLLLPFLALVYQVVFAQDQLGPDPAARLVRHSGEWAIRFIMLALAMTPLRIITNSTVWIRLRRMVGLYAFFYAVVHFTVYYVFWLQLDFQRIWDEIVHRPYIIVGAIALLLYIPLAVTSTQAWKKRLKRHWLTLHKLVYVIGILAVIHMTWLQKVGIYDTWPYVLILFVLFAIRIIHAWHVRLRKV